MKFSTFCFTISLCSSSLLIGSLETDDEFPFEYFLVKIVSDFVLIVNLFVVNLDLVLGSKLIRVSFSSFGSAPYTDNLSSSEDVEEVFISKEIILSE